jgi:hypothetical protein
MSLARSIRHTVLVGTIISMAVPASAAMLDALTTPLPPNACLPLSGARIAFSGPRCDGTLCPPDPMADPACADGDFAGSDPGTAGVFPGFGRGLSVAASAPEDVVSAEINDALGLVEFHATTLYNHKLRFDYRTDPFGPGVDLLAAGATGVTFEVQGDISTDRPLYCSLTLFIRIPGGAAGYSAYIARIDQPGTVTLLFSALDPLLLFELQDVDGISWTLDSCDPLVGCTTPDAQPRSYTVGPISFVSSPPVPAKRTSWGQVKAHYR